MNDSYMYLLVKSILTLFFLLGLFGAAMYALKRFARSESGSSSRAAVKPVKVIASAFLGPKRNIAIVEVAGEMLVLGLTPTTITFLSKIEGKDALEDLRRLKDGKQRSLFGILQGGI
ncbi:MAG: flagellar biosynthetic protein FliO [Deltaproteobacteria bacterium]|nr:flagellar biosynthetic protein FliO [Deltaproteobacteria bacterium]MBZ0219285.1 flagellar biosynthetic protein FliO [Deltaproteobacteria bacterium]